MYRVVLACLISTIVFTSAYAIDLFHKHWKAHYLTDNSDELFVKAARSAGCYVCHVKGKEKDEVRNEYGRALAQYLDADDFPDDWVDANPEETKRRIIEAFRKAEEDLALDDRRFGQKIDAGELPAADSGLGRRNLPE